MQLCFGDPIKINYHSFLSLEHRLHANNIVPFWYDLHCEGWTWTKQRHGELFCQKSVKRNYEDHKSVVRILVTMVSCWCSDDDTDKLCLFSLTVWHIVKILRSLHFKIFFPFSRPPIISPPTPPPLPSHAHTHIKTESISISFHFSGQKPVPEQFKPYYIFQGL